MLEGGGPLPDVSGKSDHGTLTCAAAAEGEVLRIQDISFPLNHADFIIPRVGRQKKDLAREVELKLVEKAYGEGGPAPCRNRRDYCGPAIREICQQNKEETFTGSNFFSIKRYVSINAVGKSEPGIL